MAVASVIPQDRAQVGAFYNPREELAAEAEYLRDLVVMASDHSRAVTSAAHALLEHVWTNDPDREEGEDLIYDFKKAALVFAVRLGPVLHQRARALAEGWGGKWSEHFINDFGLTVKAAAYLRPLFEQAGALDDFQEGPSE